MDFDSIITIILILLFFVFPSILKQLAQKKKTEKEAPQRVTKLSLFERLGEQIREYALTIEKQGQKQPEQVWEELAEEQESPAQYEQAYEPDPDPEERDFEPYARPLVRKEPEKPVVTPKKFPPAAQDALPCFASLQREPSSLELQQAVIWAEILAKPIALRGNSM